MTSFAPHPDVGVMCFTLTMTGMATETVHAVHALMRTPPNANMAGDAGGIAVSGSSIDFRFYLEQESISIYGTLACFVSVTFKAECL